MFDDRASRIKTKTAMIYALLLAANAASWIWAWTEFASRPALLGTAFLAYLLGLRHAFDADHIAAIDNVVRKLVQEGKAPHSTGFFFSLGHSTIVVLASVVIAATATAAEDKLAAIRGLGGMIGTVVSFCFLLLIGLSNLLILRGIWSAFSKARSGGKLLDEDLGPLLGGRGFLTRIFRPLFRLVSRSWHMYPIGFLFGLGFDTATEIGLLGISATQATRGMPIWAILVFPALFAAGMSLMDTTDSVIMTHAYGWAFTNPIRKLWYNLTMTGACVVVALFIGGVEALGVLCDSLNLDGDLWRLVARLNDNLTTFGCVLVGIFAAIWLGFSLVYRARTDAPPVSVA
jgi:high-affinity nickel-transport protein